MSVELSFSPQPLALPNCWVSSKPIGPIVVTYDGPSLVDSTITLKFTGEVEDQEATWEDISDAEFPNRHLITFAAFVPGNPGTSDNKVKYKMEIIYADERPEILFYGTWSLRVLEDFD